VPYGWPLGDPPHLPRLDAGGSCPLLSLQPLPVIGPPHPGITTIIDGGHAAAISALRRSGPTSGTALDSPIFAGAQRSPMLPPPRSPEISSLAPGRFHAGRSGKILLIDGDDRLVVLDDGEIIAVDVAGVSTLVVQPGFPVCAVGGAKLGQ
jgi:hypothetical protein